MWRPAPEGFVVLALLVACHGPLSTDKDAGSDTAPGDSGSHGSFGQGDTACTPPPVAARPLLVDHDLDGYDRSEDCDDGLASTHPGALEVADGVDNDCDWLVDEYLTRVDADEDGYTEREGDCDDEDAGRNPGLEEVAGDGVDENCDGSEVVSTFRLADGGGVWVTLGSDAQGSTSGRDVAFLGDVDGDCLTDVGVRTTAELQDYESSSGHSGATYVLMEPMSGLHALSHATVILHDDGWFESGGGSVDRLGDLDGDGLSDFAVGTPVLQPEEVIEGRLDAFGRDAGGRAGGVKRLFRLRGDKDTLLAGFNQTGIGDWDGDGLDDFAAVLYSPPYSQILIFEGPYPSELGVEDAVARMTGESPGDDAGGTVEGRADTNGDGYADLLIGGIDWKTDYGRAWLVTGPRTGDLSLADADASISGESTRAFAGYSVSMGDVDADGRADLAVGAALDSEVATDAGKLALFRSPVSGDRVLSDADTLILPEGARDWLGSAVSIASDMDGDGRTDLLVGSPHPASDQYYPGRTFVWFDIPAGRVSTAQADGVLLGAFADFSGSTLDARGDVDGDGRADLVVGAPYDVSEAVGGGRAYVVTARDILAAWGR